MLNPTISRWEGLCIVAQVTRPCSRGNRCLQWRRDSWERGFVTQILVVATTQWLTAVMWVHVSSCELMWAHVSITNTMVKLIWRRWKEVVIDMNWVDDTKVERDQCEMGWATFLTTQWMGPKPPPYLGGWLTWLSLSSGRCWEVFVSYLRVPGGLQERETILLLPWLQGTSLW